MAIDLQELEAELLKTRHLFSDWAASRSQFAGERKDQHVGFLLEQVGKLAPVI